MLCISPVYNGRDKSKPPTGPHPCGQCIPCRVNARRVWTFRMSLEAQTHLANSWLTLTYSNDFYPDDGSVSKAVHSSFIKRLREEVRIKYGFLFRHFSVGEYGDATGRAHYHSVLFGYPPCVFGKSTYDRGFSDCCEWCDFIRDKWGQGNIELAVVGRAQMQYCAGYAVKKMTRKDDVRLQGRAPEFGNGSRRPGVGVPGLDSLADALAARGDLVTLSGDVQHFFVNGGHAPLGRLLIDKLRERLCHESAAEVRSLLQRERMQVLWDDFKSSEEGSYFEYVEAEKASRLQKARNLEARLKIKQSMEGLRI